MDQVIKTFHHYIWRLDQVFKTFHQHIWRWMKSLKPSIDISYDRSSYQNSIKLNFMVEEVIETHQIGLMMDQPIYANEIKLSKPYFTYSNKLRHGIVLICSWLQCIHCAAVINATFVGHLLGLPSSRLLLLGLHSLGFLSLRLHSLGLFTFDLHLMGQGSTRQGSTRWGYSRRDSCCSSSLKYKYSLGLERVLLLLSHFHTYYKNN